LLLLLLPCEGNRRCEIHKKETYLGFDPQTNAFEEEVMVVVVVAREERA